MKRTLILAALAAATLSLAGCKDKIEQKPALMRFDATGNISTMSSPDSVDFYLHKIKELGFTHAVVDMRPISGHVLYDSEIAPELTEWKGVKCGDFDYLQRFIDTGHKLGLEIHASMNTFVDGHNYFDVGACYEDHPEWATILYTPQGLHPVTEEKGKYSAMVNPILPDYQDYIISLMKELVTEYPELDGLVLDRVRYDGIMADFSDYSKTEFEKYAGCKIGRFPEDVYEWVKYDNGSVGMSRGPLFNKWIEWRAMNIHDFMVKAKAEVKSVNPKVSFGTYTGAWYPSYYEVGVNFASNTYDPSVDFDWATPEYRNSGYAEVMDLYTTGNYYKDITIEDYEKTNNIVRNETDLEGRTGTWYCVEGSCEKLRGIMGGNPFYGGILCDQFYENRPDLSRTIEMNLKASDGLMVFDICHIISHNLWAEVEDGMRAGGNIK